MDQEEALDFDEDTLDDTHLPKRRRKTRKRSCPVCGGRFSGVLARHISLEHCPWYVGVITACFQCKQQTGSDQTKRFKHTKCKSLNSKQFADWQTSLLAILNFFVTVFGLQTHYDLVEFAILNNLYPCDTEQSMKENIFLRAASVNPLQPLTFSPPSDPMALFQWRTLGNLLHKLSDLQRKQFRELPFLTSSSVPPLLVIDSHFHLDMLYRDNLASIQSSASSLYKFISGVANYVFPDHWRHLKRQIDAHPNIRFSIGVHPRFAATGRHSLPLHFLDHPRCVAIGEIGIDLTGSCECLAGNRCSTGECLTARQVAYLREVLPLAAAKDKAVVFHCRDRGNQSCSYLVMDVLRELELTHLRMHVHCFNGSMRTVEAWLNLGPNVYIGLGPLLLNSKEQFISMLGSVPLDRLVLESDAPYLPPATRPNTCVGTFAKFVPWLAMVYQVPPQVLVLHNAANVSKLYNFSLF